MITTVTVILIITIIIVSLLFGYYFGKSVGITMAINYIEDKYTNKNKQVSNILNNYNKIKKTTAIPIIKFLVMFGFNFIMLLLLFLYYEFQC
jgi:hypothetical protein